jgi:hypothetical protein
MKLRVGELDPFKGPGKPEGYLQNGLWMMESTENCSEEQPRSARFMTPKVVFIPLNMDHEWWNTKEQG